MDNSLEEGQSLNLSGALALFADHLDDIKEAVADNMLYALAQLSTPLSTGDENRDWVRSEVHALQVKNATETRARILKRLVAHQQNSISPRAGITDADIERAKEYPIAELCDTRIVAGMTTCPFHPDSTASLSFRRHNRYRCFGCDARGSVIDFYMKTRGVGFIPAVRALSAGV